jgi:hypothetical protein
MADLQETPTENAHTVTEGGAFEGKKWHEIWNPLTLDQVEPQRENQGGMLKRLFDGDRKYLFAYYVWNSTSTIIGPVVPVLVLLGDPAGDVSQNSVYWVILITYVGYVALFTIPDYLRMVDNKTLSFFKITLHTESKREHIEFRKVVSGFMTTIAIYIVLLSFIDYIADMCEKKYYSFYEGKNISIYDCNWSDYTKKMCPFHYELESGGTNSTPTNDCDSKILNAAPDAPTFASLNFIILVFFFIKSVYDFYQYNEIFASFMLPTGELVEKYYPEVHKFAQEKLPHRSMFDAERFEPNIPIRPIGQEDWKIWEWLTDSQVVLKNVLLACSRVQAYVIRHPMTETEKQWTISQLSEHVKTQSQNFVNPALLDDSIHWGCAHF